MFIKRLFSAIVFISGCFCVQPSFSQENEDLLHFVEILESSLNALSQEVIKFNQVVLFSENPSEVQKANLSLMNIAKKKKEALEGLPVLAHDSAFYYNCLGLFHRQYDKVQKADALYKQYDKTNWNAFVLMYLIENKNTGAQSNKLMSELNGNLRAIGKKYNMVINEREEMHNRMSSYNLAMDHLNAGQIIFLETMPFYLNVMESINTQESDKIKESRDSYLEILKTSIEKTNDLALGLKDSKLTAALNTYLLSMKTMSLKEISRIAKIFENDLTSNEQVANLNQLILQVNEMGMESQKDYISGVQRFFLQYALIDFN